MYNNEDYLNQPKLSALFSAIPKYLSVLAAIIISVSIVHEYAYFILTGQEFITIYSATDFLKLSINWIPLVVLSSLIGSAIKYFDESRRASAFLKNPEKAKKTYKYPDLSMKIQRYFLLFFCAVGLVFISIKNLLALQIISMFVFMYVANILINTGRLPITNRPIEADIFYNTIIIFLTTAFFGGIREAVRDLEKTTPKFELLATNSAADRPVIVLRAIDKGVLFREIGNTKISFIPWDEIKILRSEAVHISKKNLYDYVRQYFR